MTPARFSARPPKGRIPTIQGLVAACPWPSDAPEPREHARRVASSIQAREYLIWMLEQHPPNLSVAHGLAETFWARDGAILEDILVGHARWTLARPGSAATGLQKALDAVQCARPLPADLARRIDRARHGRNRATHGRRAPQVRTDYRRLSEAGLRRLIDVDLISDVIAELSRRT